MTNNDGIQCWFCGTGIEKEDTQAVEVSLRNLWSNEDDPPKQYFWLHSVCALEKLQGKGPKLDLDVFTDSR
ncbi:hypothetical protein DPM33_13880 [Mesorhizobium hawassense]|uniref:PARP-type domain-containing protein n=1 Tax=Mesorhizobium hawassense TaxID=1209954 RepID=A0A330HQ02_9HYPH|nr:hypothetical protein [Mesorhizobium hawassense]RAZ90585.1 hypothetical protein DPM33_13880 [Mesorhizobium hawassense]